MFELIFGPLCLLSVAAAVADNVSKQQNEPNPYGPGGEWDPMKTTYEPKVRMWKVKKNRLHEIFYVTPTHPCPSMNRSRQYLMFQRITDLRGNVTIEKAAFWNQDAFERSVDSRLEWGWDKETLDVGVLSTSKFKEYMNSAVSNLSDDLEFATA